MTETLSAILLAGAAVVVVLAAVVLYRVVAGPTTYDRVLAVNVVGTSTVIVIVFVSAGLDRPEYLDIAIVYALLNFVLSLAVGRFTYQSGEVKWR